MMMCFLLQHSINFHMLQLLQTVHPIFSFIIALVYTLFNQTRTVLSEVL